MVPPGVDFLWGRRQVFGELGIRDPPGRRNSPARQDRQIGLLTAILFSRSQCWCPMSEQRIEALLGRLNTVRWFQPEDATADQEVVRWAVKEHVLRLKKVGLPSGVKGLPDNPPFNIESLYWRDALKSHADIRELREQLHEKARKHGQSLVEGDASKTERRDQTKQRLTRWFNERLLAVKDPPDGLTAGDVFAVNQAVSEAKRDCRSVASSYVCGYLSPFEPLIILYELGFWPLTLRPTNGGWEFLIVSPPLKDSRKLLSVRRPASEVKEQLDSASADVRARRHQLRAAIKNHAEARFQKHVVLTGGVALLVVATLALIEPTRNFITNEVWPWLNWFSVVSGSIIGAIASFIFRDKLRNIRPQQVKKLEKDLANKIPVDDWDTIMRED